MIRRMSLLAGAFALVLVVAGCSSSPSIEVTEVRIGRPTGPNAALYLTVTSGGEEDSLVAASTEVADRVELHESSMSADGTMTMQPVESFPVPASGSLVLEPGGLHLMLVEVERLEVGDTVDVQLEFADAGTVDVTAEVVAPAATMGEEDG
jgi:periplasmic copper chaperone A